MSLHPPASSASPTLSTSPTSSTFAPDPPSGPSTSAAAGPSGTHGPSGSTPPSTQQGASRLDVANSLLLNPKGSTTLSRLDLHQVPSDKPVFSCSKCSEVLVSCCVPEIGVVGPSASGGRGATARRVESRGWARAEESRRGKIRTRPSFGWNCTATPLPTPCAAGRVNDHGAVGVRRFAYREHQVVGRPIMWMDTPYTWRYAHS